jgi:hypothetical protein
MIRAALVFSLFFATVARAAGPVAPPGWDGSFEPTLPSGQSCCLPADLNGTGLVGGAFVLLTSNKQTFGIFALTYTRPLKERWQLLEKHPISKLANYSVSIEPSGRFPFESIKVCASETQCHFYFTATAKGSFKRSGTVRNAH